MDVVRTTPKTALWRKPKFIAGLVTLILVALALWQYSKDEGFQTRSNSLSIGAVQQGNFLVTVKGTGLLVPKNVRWIAANVSGRVESIQRKPGAVLQAGDVILVLSNPELLQEVEELEWEVEAEEAQLQALEVNLASQLLDQEALVLASEMDYEGARIQLEAEKTLLDEGNATVSMIDYQRSQLATKQFLNRWQIEQQRMERLKENRVAQLNAAQARLNRLRKTLTRAEEQVNSLTVKAPDDGVLQALPLEPGEQVMLGANMAKLAKQDELIAELQIAERRIRDVQVDQEVTIDTRLSKLLGKVIRIDPAVEGGTVQVDVAFVDPLPPEARPDLTVDGIIATAALDNALYVNRPHMAQNQSQSTVFKISKDGKKAEKIVVNFGVGSASQIQVIAGLTPGEQIILSDSSAFQHLNQISIN